MVRRDCRRTARHRHGRISRQSACQSCWDDSAVKKTASRTRLLCGVATELLRPQKDTPPNKLVEQFSDLLPILPRYVNISRDRSSDDDVLTII